MVTGVFGCERKLDWFSSKQPLLLPTCGTSELDAALRLL